ncbi:hypothetical protein NDU88_005205 [Pleurodeles waltl]|uniref:Uncharacterized protein n=1 Tax=Pleurodeles waltl TaxID=8319 RepID=A0AAV7SL50_PLEWA|nr:hypothetical protein NDU88_005205 [Pleurodeles waltl]
MRSPGNRLSQCYGGRESGGEPLGLRHPRYPPLTLLSSQRVALLVGSPDLTSLLGGSLPAAPAFSTPLHLVSQGPGAYDPTSPPPLLTALEPEQPNACRTWTAHCAQDSSLTIQQGGPTGFVRPTHCAATGTCRGAPNSTTAPGTNARPAAATSLLLRLQFLMLHHIPGQAGA